MSDDDVASRLRLARAQAGFVDATAAARSHGFNANTYRSHENGTRGVKRDSLEAYARAFRVRANWLLTGDGDVARRIGTYVSGFVEESGHVKRVDVGGSKDTQFRVRFSDYALAEGSPFFLCLYVSTEKAEPIYFRGDIILIGYNEVAVFENRLEAFIRSHDEPKWRIGYVELIEPRSDKHGATVRFFAYDALGSSEVLRVTSINPVQIVVRAHYATLEAVARP